ncbi:origin recognition complex subunit 4-like [Ornithodoros turicata]
MASKRKISRKSESSGGNFNVNSMVEVKRLLTRNLSTHGAWHLVKSYDKQRRHLHDLVSRVIALGESNTVLLIGPRGSGKTALIQSVIEDVSTKSSTKGNFLLVELNGLVHTDDRTALKDMTRQLQLENVVGDRVFGSFSDNLSFLLESLKSGGDNSMPIILIIEEFDLFCQHKNQTLLYNFFDVAQSAQAPIAVIGVTCRLDAVELLEKRVKSRFSHRQLHLFNDFTFEDFVDIATALISLPDRTSDVQLRDNWNESVKELLQETSVQAALKRLYTTTKDIRMLKQLLLLPVKQLSSSCTRIEALHIVESQKAMMVDSKVAMLKGLSVLELCLVIAMLRLTQIYDGEPFNFEMVFKEYQKFIDSRSTMQSVSKPVLMKALQHLEMLEFVHPTSTNTAAQYEYRLMHLQIEPAQVKEVVLRSANMPTDVSQWATSVLSGSL